MDKKVPPSPAAVQQMLKKRAAKISFSVGVLMFVMKTGGYLVTNSAAILSDAMESVVHVVATGITLYSIILIGRPADREHPYGYGKAEYFSAGVEGALILIAAIAICYEAIRDIIVGSTLRSLDIGAWVVGAAGAINLLLGYYLVRTGKRTNSLALVADGKHVLTDSYTSIGVLVGVLLVAITGFTLLDPIFAIAVALNIIVTGYRLVSEAIRGLMNVADPATLGRVVEVIKRHRTPEMIDIHRLRAWNSGQRRFIDFHLTLPYYYSLGKAHEVGEILTDAIRSDFGGDADVMIHLDACNDECCIYCKKPDCGERHIQMDVDNPLTVTSAVGEPTYLVRRHARR
jgi:cation diffusion facilitator family transporter